MSDRQSLKLYETMLRIRMAEEAVASCYTGKEICMYIHLCTGQEGIAAGVCSALERTDYVFSNHRGHGHYIAQGGSLKRLFAELLGRRTGCSRGKGGSMHLIDLEAGVMGTSSIVAGNIPISVGSALAVKLRGLRRVVVTFFGDGAADEGVLYESLNFAALKRLPVLFVCENNAYAIFSRLNRRQAGRAIHEKARAFGVPAECLDASDALNVRERARQAVRLLRQGRGPYFLECRTHRWMAHAGPRDDWDMGYRAHEKRRAHAACPVSKLEALLVRKGLLHEESLRRMKTRLAAEIAEAISYARRSPVPCSSEVASGVYAQEV